MLSIIQIQSFWKCSQISILSTPSLDVLIALSFYCDNPASFNHSSQAFLLLTRNCQPSTETEEGLVVYEIYCRSCLIFISIYFPIKYFWSLSKFFAWFTRVVNWSQVSTFINIMSVNGSHDLKQSYHFFSILQYLDMSLCNWCKLVPHVKCTETVKKTAQDSSNGNLFFKHNPSNFAL